MKYVISYRCLVLIIYTDPSMTSRHTHFALRWWSRPLYLVHSSLPYYTRISLSVNEKVCRKWNRRYQIIPLSPSDYASRRSARSLNRIHESLLSGTEWICLTYAQLFFLTYAQLFCLEYVCVLFLSRQALPDSPIPCVFNRIYCSMIT